MRIPAGITPFTTYRSREQAIRRPAPILCDGGGRTQK